MTAGELIAELQRLDPNTAIMVNEEPWGWVLATQARFMSGSELHHPVEGNVVLIEAI